MTDEFSTRLTELVAGALLDARNDADATGSILVNLSQTLGLAVMVAAKGHRPTADTMLMAAETGARVAADGWTDEAVRAFLTARVSSP